MSSKNFVYYHIKDMESVNITYPNYYLIQIQKYLLSPHIYTLKKLRFIRYLNH